MISNLLQSGMKIFILRQTNLIVGSVERMIQANNIKKRILELLVENKKMLIYLFIAIIIGLILISPEDVLWAVDRDAYFRRATYSGYFIRRSFGNVISWFTNEPLFLYFYHYAGYIFSQYGVIKLNVFSAVLLTLLGLGRMTKYNKWVLFFLLFFPMFLLKYTTHIRQGLAMGVYFLGLSFLVKNENIGKWKYLSVIRYFSVLIHTSFVFVFGIEFLERIMKRRNLKFSMRIFIMGILGLVLSYGIPIGVYLLGDRRMGEHTFRMSPNASGLGIIMWIVFGMLLFVLVTYEITSIGFKKIKIRNMNVPWIIIEKQKDLSTNDLVTNMSIYSILIFSITYFTLDFAARNFENLLPLIFVAVVNIKFKVNKNILLVILILMGLLIWITTTGSLTRVFPTFFNIGEALR